MGTEVEEVWQPEVLLKMLVPRMSMRWKVGKMFLIDVSTSARKFLCCWLVLVVANKSKAAVGPQPREENHHHLEVAVTSLFDFLALLAMYRECSYITEMEGKAMVRAVQWGCHSMTRVTIFYGSCSNV